MASDTSPWTDHKLPSSALEAPRPEGLALVAVDMDGTFLRPDNTSGRGRFAAVREATRREGVRFVVASGNQEAQLLGFFEGEEGGVALAPDAVQSENGSIVRVGDERLIESAVDEVTLGHLIGVLEEADARGDVSCVASGPDGAFIRSSEPVGMRDYLAFYFPQYEAVGSASELAGRRVDKVSIVRREGIDPALVEELVAALVDAMVPVTSGHDSVDVIMPGRHKALGLDVLLEHWGLRREQAAVFGDSANDVEMVRAAGTGVAMANASRPALEAADPVAPGNAEDGVLAVLEHWFG